MNPTHTMSRREALVRAGQSLGVCLASSLCRTPLIAAEAAGRHVTVTPQEIDDLLVNPGIGFETFHHFNGEKQVKNYPVCSIAYFRLWWKQLEPEEGRYEWQQIETLLEKAKSHRQDVALRFMPWFAMLERDSTPEWFKRKATRSFRCKFNRWAGPTRGPTEQDYWAPDFNDPFYLDRQESLVRAFGERFNGHPDVAYLDIGSIGNWGEWHTDNTIPRLPMVTEENARKVIDWHFQAWSRTPLVMNFQYPPGQAYASARGAGWRCDGVDSPACIKRVEAQSGDSAVRDAWQRGPVTGEPVVQDLKSPPDSLARLLRWHASSLNAKSRPIPDDAVPHVDAFLKRCGYRLVLRRFRHPEGVSRNGLLSVEMEWENVGVAPPYRNYILAARLRRGTRTVILDTDARLTGWLPGKHVLGSSLRLPAELSPGDYELAIGVLDPHDREPEVKLAIKGRGPDGWYALGRVAVR